MLKKAQWILLVASPISFIHCGLQGTATKKSPPSSITDAPSFVSAQLSDLHISREEYTAHLRDPNNPSVFWLDENGHFIDGFSRGTATLHMTLEVPESLPMNSTTPNTLDVKITAEYYYDTEYDPDTDSYRDIFIPISESQLPAFYISEPLSFGENSTTPLSMSFDPYLTSVSNWVGFYGDRIQLPWGGVITMNEIAYRISYTTSFRDPGSRNPLATTNAAPTAFFQSNCQTYNPPYWWQSQPQVGGFGGGFGTIEFMHTAFVLSEYLSRQCFDQPFEREDF